VLWRRGRWTDLGTLGGAGASAWGQQVNRRGTVVGFSMLTAAGPSHAFIVKDGASMKDLGTLDGDPSSDSLAIDVNDRDQVIGAGDSTGGRSGVVWQGGKSFRLRGLTEGAGWTMPERITNHGMIVGTSTTPSGESHAAVWQAPTR
jgi:probable HAF family extracellular repeat protein